MPERKRLVVSCDGTWSTPDQTHHDQPAPTNVVKLHHCLSPRSGGVEQRAYYHPGVGTEGGRLRRTAGGAYGQGLSRNIQSAYYWLAENWREGDEVWLFGFSRGAYTVRSLAGLLDAAGLVRFGDLDVPERWRRVRHAYERVYRARSEARNADAASPCIRFVGVWDTVGALGVPNHLAVLNLLDRASAWRFHDTQLGACVESARHAIALDERRASFTPTLWTETEGRDVQQVWFAGAHGDVGGGYAEAGLSDCALEWMIGEATAAGLGFEPELVAQLRPDPAGVLHDPVSGIFRALHTRPRAIPELSQANAAHIHPSVFARQRTPPITQGPYRPVRSLEVGESHSLDVYAGRRWNETGLYLARGARYSLSAEGEWLDGRVQCGPAGTDDGAFQPQEVAHVLGSLWGLAERAWKQVTGNDEADFWFTRRLERHPWLSLIGVVANDSGAENPDSDGSARPHQHFLIGNGRDLSIEEPGYLYAWANDAWSKYEDNRGSVRLCARRLS